MRPMTTLALVAGLALVGTGGAWAQDARTVRVQFDTGTSGATITDSITGAESVDYVLGAQEGQSLTVSLRPDNQSADYNIYAPGRGPGDEALYASAINGREYKGPLGASGDYTVSVFLNRNAARGGETANYDIVFEIE